MAKKGGVQQLQSEINTNEELNKFLEKEGLLIFDVYTEWCGPCLAMVGSLKKIKLEQGGDDLQLAIVKCDQIDVFERFRNKSEPTWLFASNGKLINSAFGSNVPDLMSLITKELDIEREWRKDPAASNRTYYELNEMTPVELERYNLKKSLEEETERIEREAALRQRHEYLTFVTDKIMEHESDLGVTVLLPHIISRDLFKRISDPADKFQLTAREKKNAQIHPDHLEVMNFDCTNPLPKYLLDHVMGKDVFMVCWKVNDGESRPVEEILGEFVSIIAHDQPIKDEFGVINPDLKVPSMLKSLSLMVEEEPESEDDTLDEAKNLQPTAEEPSLTESIAAEIDSVLSMALDSIKAEDVELNQQNVNSKTNDCDTIKESGDGGAADGRPNTETISQVGPDKTSEVKPKIKKNDKKTQSLKLNVIRIVNKVKKNIPAAWTPANKRANASLIYLYFRTLIEHFLPPDPVPEKPHIAMVFDSYKRRDLMDIIGQYSEDILAYGYFTTDDCNTASLIANSTYTYQKNPPTMYDKCHYALQGA